MMKLGVLCLAVVSAIAHADHATAWFNQIEVGAAAKRFQLEVSDFESVLLGVPGTSSLKEKAKVLSHRAARFSDFAQSGEGANVEKVLKHFDGLKKHYFELRLTLRTLQVTEKTEYFMYDFYKVMDAFSRLEYRLLSPETVEPPPAPIEPTLPPITLSQSVVVGTGLYSPSGSDFQKAVESARAQCLAWKTAVASSTAGKVLLGSCGGGSQVKTFDGKVGAEVTGEMRLNFDNLPGLVAPTQVKFPILVSTGLYSPSLSDVDTASKSASAACDTWIKNTIKSSRGSFLYSNCGAAKVQKGYDDRMWISVEASSLVSWRRPKSEPQMLTQSFQVSTGLYSPSGSDIARAGSQAQSQCLQWLNELSQGSSAVPLLATCTGPDVVKAEKIEVRFSGKAIMALP